MLLVPLYWYRLEYGVYMLEKILEDMQSKQISEVYMMYDIACTLSSHLKVKWPILRTVNIAFSSICLQKLGRTDILSRTHLCLPTFHCYGHKLSCQVSLLDEIS